MSAVLGEKMKLLFVIVCTILWGLAAAQGQLQIRFAQYLNVEDPNQPNCNGNSDLIQSQADGKCIDLSGSFNDVPLVASIQSNCNANTNGGTLSFYTNRNCAGNGDQQQFQDGDCLTYTGAETNSNVGVGLRILCQSAGDPETFAPVPTDSPTPSSSISASPSGTATPSDEFFISGVRLGLAPPGDTTCGSTVATDTIASTCNEISWSFNEAAARMWITDQCNSDRSGGSVTVYSTSGCSGSGTERSFQNGDCLEFSSSQVDSDVGVSMTASCDDGSGGGGGGGGGGGSPSATPTPNATPTATPVCFADDAQVRLIDGSVRPLRSVEVGDLVQSYDDKGRSTFSEVFLVQHTGATQRVAMRRIEFSAEHGSGSITVSGGHYLDAGADGRMVRADELAVGDAIYVIGRDESRAKAVVQEVSTVYAAPRNVHTMNDRVVVDGVLATPFTEVEFIGVNSMRLRALLLPLKGLYLIGFSRLVRVLDHLANAAVIAARPSGSLPQ